MKKIFALFLSVIMMLSLSIMPVTAEMITVTVPAATVIDQSFAGPLTEVPDGWALTGTYTFGEKGIRATNYSGFKLYNNTAFDAGNADYTFSAAFAHNSGKSYLHFGASTEADAIAGNTTATGYTMLIESKNNNTGVYTIYKNGTQIGSLTDSNTSYGFQSNRMFTFKVSSDTITVTGAGDTFTVEDAEPIKKGYVGIKLCDNNGNKGNLASMSLSTEEYSYEMEKPAEAVTGAAVTYEKPGKSYMDYDFRGAAEIPAGVTPGTDYTLSDNGIGWTGYLNKTTTFEEISIPNEITNFVIEAGYTALYDGGPKFNFFGYTLEKTGKHNADKTFTLKKNGETLGTPAVWTYTGTSDYSAGPIPVKISFNGNAITVNVNGRDLITDAVDNNVSKSGTVSIVAGYVGNFKISHLKISSPAINVTKSNFLMDKTFSSVDTTASLSADGYSITGVSNYQDDKGIVREADGKVNAYYNNATFSGAYTLEVTAAKTMNNGTVYFNRQNSSNYYSVATKSGNASSGTIWIKKTVDGTASSLLTDDTGAAVESLSTGMGTNDETNYKISMQPLDTGDMKIIVTITNYAGTVKSYTVIDKKTETNTPFTSGTFGYENSYSGSGNNRIESFKAYPNPAEGEEAVKYEGIFNIGGTDVTKLQKGSTLFRFPVAMIGQTPDFIAALYEDFEMTDVKIFDVYDMNEGIIQLFNTASSTADLISINVYTWNELTGLEPILKTYQLNQ